MQESITFQTTLDDIEPHQLTGFFVDWPNHPSPKRHLEILRTSHGVELAIDNTTNQVVGFINVISDGLFTAYIPLLEVLPSYQGSGIGGTLIDRITHRYSHLYMLDVCCDENIVPIYNEKGFIKVAGMVRRNFERQSAQ